MERLHPEVERHVLAVLHRHGFGYLAGSHLQDIVNHVWRDLFENISRFEQGEFGPWFAYRRVKRVLDYLRKEARHVPPRRDPDPDREPAAAARTRDPERQVLLREIRAGLEQLPPRYALVLKCYYWDGLSYGEIADLLGLGHNSIGSLHARALKKLRKTLTLDGAALTLILFGRFAA